MAASVFKTKLRAGGTALAETVPAGAVADGQTLQVVSVHFNFSAAPTTSENLTITYDSVQGADWDTLEYSYDPSAASATDIVWYPDYDLTLEGGDAIVIAYANTDTATIGVTATLKAVRW